MPAYRCSICNINFPPHVPFRVCPSCDEGIDYYTNVIPDTHWQKRLDEARAGIKHDVPTRPEPDTDAATVVYDATSDMMKVHHNELVNLHLEDAQSFDIVKLNGKYYELLERDRHSDFWNVQRIDMYALLEDLDAALGAPYEGPSSDDIKQIEFEDGSKIYWDPRHGDPPT